MKPQAPVFVTCYVHNTPVPRAAANSHHVTPQAAGGAKGKQVWVCASCHSVLHRISEQMVLGKQGIARDLASQYAPTPAMRQRLMYLVENSAEAMNAAAEGQAGRDEVIIQVELPAEVAHRFRLLVGDLRIQGRKIGMSRFLRLLIERELKKKNLL